MCERQSQIRGLNIQFFLAQCRGRIDGQLGLLGEDQEKIAAVTRPDVIEPMLKWYNDGEK